MKIAWILTRDELPPVEKMVIWWNEKEKASRPAKLENDAGWGLTVVYGDYSEDFKPEVFTHWHDLLPPPKANYRPTPPHVFHNEHYARISPIGTRVRLAYPDTDEIKIDSVGTVVRLPDETKARHKETLAVQFDDKELYPDALLYHNATYFEPAET